MAFKSVKYQLNLCSKAIYERISGAVVVGGGFGWCWVVLGCDGWWWVVVVVGDWWWVV